MFGFTRSVRWRVLSIAAIWAAISWAPFSVAGEWWGMLWFPINLPLSALVRDLDWMGLAYPYLYVVSVTIVNGFTLALIVEGFVWLGARCSRALRRRG